LRPLVIDEQGVVNAIEFLIAEEEARGGLKIQFFHHVSFDRLPPLVEGSLYRIVQECLNNARRHSGSTDVEVWLHEDNQRLKLLVRDYGCGFDPDKVPDDRFGLESISKRAQIFGGNSEIESHVGEGTTIRVEIPLATT
jgi:two-component system sensor histidine kinase DegS